jgi:DNA-binding MarR family transcriptional regulator
LQDVLTGLRTAGLIENAAAEPRGRAQSLALTPQGARRLRTAHEAVFGVEDVMLQGISVSERRSVAEALLSCAKNLED